MKTKERKSNTTTISARVPNEVAEIFESFCNSRGLKKSAIISKLLVDKYGVNKDKLSPLMQLLLKLRLIVPIEKRPNSESETTPCIITGTDEDEEYEGKLQILVGDDSVIRENDGKFYVFDFHDVDAEPIWLNEKEILDFYEGQWQAYDFPTSEFNSYHHIRGFSKVARSLLGRLEYFVEHKVAKPL